MGGFACLLVEQIHLLEGPQAGRRGTARSQVRHYGIVRGTTGPHGIVRGPVRARCGTAQRVRLQLMHPLKPSQATIAGPVSCLAGPRWLALASVGLRWAFADLLRTHPGLIMADVLVPAAATALIFIGCAVAIAIVAWAARRWGR